MVHCVSECHRARGWRHHWLASASLVGGLMEAFERAFDLVMTAEGGYVDDPRDAGGATKFGISQRAYPNEDIEHMTLSRARQLYRRDYWDPIAGDKLPDGLAVALFDFAVNSGVRRAVLTLQRLLDVVADGAMGPKTVAAANRAALRTLIVCLSAERLAFLASLPTFRHFGIGWSRRVINTALETA